MIIRKATVNDLPKLNKIKERKMDELFLKRIKEMEQDKAVYLVAEEDADVVGYIHLKLYGLPHLPDFPSIEDLKVRVDHRRKGIGSALIAECEKIAKEHGFKQVSIQVNPEPDCPAQIMYKKLGYKDIGNKPYLDGVYDGVEDWVIDMIKEL